MISDIVKSKDKWEDKHQKDFDIFKSMSLYKDVVVEADPAKREELNKLREEELLRDFAKTYLAPDRAQKVVKDIKAGPAFALSTQALVERGLN